MLVRFIAPKWALEDGTLTRRAFEGDYSEADIQRINAQGYNAYYLPNHPSEYDPSTTVDGTHIDVWNYVFVDCDLKDQIYESKEQFIEAVGATDITPSRIVDSGGGVHVYWKVQGLDPMAYLRFQRRLAALLCTDTATTMIFQLMRLPGTLNTKVKGAYVPCELLLETPVIYTAEELDQLLPPITLEDEAFCKQHFDKTYNLNQDETPISDELPPAFGKLISTNKEAQEIWGGIVDDRSKGDYRLGHLMFANGFTKGEALSVLVNSAKALARAPIHRRSYAEGIANKIWTYEATKSFTGLSQSVADILSTGDDEALKGERFPCHSYFDGTEHGYRLGQVIGLVAGVGVGKTAIAINKFFGFVEKNPSYDHMFVSLEQPAREIAARWKKRCGSNTGLHTKVHILSNYNDDGSYRNLSLSQIQEYILEFQKSTGKKLGCIVIDHLGVLKQEKRPGEFQGISDICAQLKAFAISTNTLLIIQSQTSREKAGIGDLELFKDAAYGTQNFEAYLDYLMVAWQPLKRCYDNATCPRVTAYKFAKVRFKAKTDVLIEDQCYRLLFDQDTETLRPMTQDEERSFDFFAKQAVNLRKKDRKTDLVAYTSVKWGGSDNEKSEVQPRTDSNNRSQRH